MSNIIDDFKLLELVQQNTHLYIKNHAEYRDKLKKTITWTTIGAVMGVSGEHCRKRFQCLRDRFNRERKVRQEEMLADPHLPAVFKKMFFLWDHIQHRRLVPVATRLVQVPSDDKKDAECVTGDIEKQILILKKETVDTDETQNGEISESNLHNIMANCPEETSQEGIAAEEQKSCLNIPVATRFVQNTPANDRKNAKDITEEIETQIFIFKEENTDTCETRNYELVGNGSQNITSSFLYKTLTESNAFEKNNIFGSHIVPRNPNNSPEPSSEILVTNRTVENNSALQKSNNNCINDRQNMITEITSNYEHQNDVNNAIENNIEIVEESGNVHYKNRIHPKLDAKRKLSQCHHMLPKPKRKVCDNIIGNSSKKADLQTCSTIPSPRPSCNEAFCAVVKNYLDKIKNPERLSATRLQILTILHNELYSTCS